MSPLHHHFELQRLEGKHRDRPLLDSLDHLRAPRSRHPQTCDECDVYANQTIAVFGAGQSGTAAAVAPAERRRHVTVLDSAEENKLLKIQIEALRRRGITVIAGRPPRAKCSATTTRRAQPRHRSASRSSQNFSARGIEMIGELELGMSVPSCPIIGITGTNGKTTTTELAGANAERVRHKDRRLRQHRQTALSKRASEERGSRRADASRSVRSSSKRSSASVRAIASGSNFAPDHLDRYRSMDEYHAAKLRIFENQTADDWAVVNCRRRAARLQARTSPSAPTRTRRDFALAKAVDCFRGAAGAALAETKLRGVAQRREPDGHARRRPRART